MFHNKEYIVTKIGDSAFYMCNGFEGNLTIPENVTIIGSNAFYQCSGFNGPLVMPNSIIHIGEYAFFNCIGLTGVLTLPSNIEVIESHAFCWCCGFQGALILPSTITNIGTHGFSCCSGIKYCKFLGTENIPHYDSHIFLDCSFSYIIVPYEYKNNVFVGYYVSYQVNDDYACNFDTQNKTCRICNYLSQASGKLDIPVTFTYNNIEYTTTIIGQSAFYQCSGFNGSLIIPKSIKSIEENAFYQCSGFTGDLIIPNQVSFIEDNAFYQCTGFSGYLSLPKILEYIGSNAFYQCSGLDSCYFYGDHNITSGSNIFKLCNFSFIYVLSSYNDSDFCGYPIKIIEESIISEVLIISGIIIGGLALINSIIYFCIS